MNARSLAVSALLQIDEGAYANLAVPPLLDRSGLSDRDRHFVTELVYGTTRMRRACDWLVGRFVDRPLDPDVRAALRLGAYQLHFLGTPPHAAVSATVDAAPKRARGLVNAVLRKVANAPITWPDVATRLSYPDWIVDVLLADLGEVDGVAALEAMNRSVAPVERADGYVQDAASQQVAAFVAALPGERILDLCAAPGGKATTLAGSGFVVAADIRAHRARLIAENAARLGTTNLAVVQADGRCPPFPAGAFDRVLVDAPCSGLGVLHRRPDARWRHQPSDVEALAELQRALLAGAAELVRPGGSLVYSVCTMTAAETTGIADWLAARLPDWRPVPPPWPGGLLLPQAAGTDGMFLVALTRPG